MFESITNILSLLFGGSVISIVTWRFARRKAYAEAKQAEAEARKAEAEAKQEQQNYYQQVIDDIAKDRDYYKQAYQDMRDRMDKLSKSVMDWKLESEDERLNLKREVMRLGRKVDSMTPFMCGDLGCRLRQRVTISAEGVVDTKPVPKDIEPYDDKPDA